MGRDGRERRWSNVTDTAAYLQIHRCTLQRWMQTGKAPPSHKQNSLVRFDLNEVDDWIAEGRRYNTAPSSRDREC